MEIELVSEKLRPLARLYPSYSFAELEEAYENLRRYVRISMEVAKKLEREGRLDEVLTKAGVNPTVKPLEDHSQSDL